MVQRAYSVYRDLQRNATLQSKPSTLLSHFYKEINVYKFFNFSLWLNLTYFTRLKMKASAKVLFAFFSVLLWGAIAWNNLNHTRRKQHIVARRESSFFNGRQEHSRFKPSNFLDENLLTQIYASAESIYSYCIQRLHNQWSTGRYWALGY